MGKTVTIVLQIGWFLVAGASAVFTLLLFAFADSPEMGRVASRLFYPLTGLGLLAACVGAYFIRLHSAWWHFPLAYVLILIACYKLFL